MSIYRALYCAGRRRLQIKWSDVFHRRTPAGDGSNHCEVDTMKLYRQRRHVLATAALGFVLPVVASAAGLSGNATPPQLDTKTAQALTQQQMREQEQLNSRQQMQSQSLQRQQAQERQQLELQQHSLSGPPSLEQQARQSTLQNQQEQQRSQLQLQQQGEQQRLRQQQLREEQRSRQP